MGRHQGKGESAAYLAGPYRRRSFADVNGRDPVKPKTMGTRRQDTMTVHRPD